MRVQWVEVLGANRRENENGYDTRPRADRAPRWVGLNPRLGCHPLPDAGWPVSLKRAVAAPAARQREPTLVGAPRQRAAGAGACTRQEAASNGRDVSATVNGSSAASLR